MRTNPATAVRRIVAVVTCMWMGLGAIVVAAGETQVAETAGRPQVAATPVVSRTNPGVLGGVAEEHPTRSPDGFTWTTVDGGGGTSEGGGLSVEMTIGQADAGLLTGAGVSVVGGFVPGLDTSGWSAIFSDGFETGDTSGWSAAVPAPATTADGVRPIGGRE